MNCKLYKICIADFMLHQFKKTILMKEYAEMRQEEKKERKKMSETKLETINIKE